ncbi:MAG: hypothetical protein JOZ22_21200 [Acidobacteriia bacterium]|nr:hypothetical protein [Terriglobia bacterium]
MDIEGTMEFILQCHASTEAILERMAATAERHEKDIAVINATLRRAIRLSVEEQRRERVRRQQLDAEFQDKVDKLASAQLLAEEQMSELRDMFKKWFLQRSTNGQQSS